MLLHNKLLYCSVIEVQNAQTGTSPTRFMATNVTFEMEVEVAVQVHATTTPVATPAVLATLHLRAILSPQADLRSGRLLKAASETGLHTRYIDRNTHEDWWTTA